MKSPAHADIARRTATAGMVSVVIAGLVFGSTAPSAQVFPAKTVTVMVPTVAGSAPDSYARALAEQLAKTTGGTFIVDNKPVAAGNQAAEVAARAPADGSTLLLGTQALTTINPTTYPQAKWQPKDFKGIVKGVEAPLVLVAHPSVPAKDFTELRAWLEKERGKIPYASFGGGTPSHFLGHQLSEKLKAEMFHVPYKGSAPQINDLLGGQVQLGFTQLATSAPHIQGGKLKALAQTGSKRSRLLPQVPTLAELGLPDLTSTVWFGVMAPAATPPAVLDAIRAAAIKAHQDPSFRARLEAQGFDMADSLHGQAFDKAIAEESARWAGVVKATGFKAVD